MGVPYGYYISPNGYVAIDQEKANMEIKDSHSGM